MANKEDRNSTYSKEMDELIGSKKETNIKFKVKEKTFTILEIYDVLGQRVNTLIRKELAAGEYTIIWRGIDEKGKKVPSGIYMSLLKVNGRSFSKKMVLIR